LRAGGFIIFAKIMCHQQTRTMKRKGCDTDDACGVSDPLLEESLQAVKTTTTTVKMVTTMVYRTRMLIFQTTTTTMTTTMAATVVSSTTVRIKRPFEYALGSNFKNTRRPPDLQDDPTRHNRSERRAENNSSCASESLTTDLRLFCPQQPARHVYWIM